MAAQAPAGAIPAVKIRTGRPRGSASPEAFSFIGKASSSTVTLLNTNTLLINARCDSRGRPIVFAFTSAAAADLFGHRFDSRGGLTTMNSSNFTKAGHGIELSSTRSTDYNSSGVVLFEDADGKVVTVNYAYDNSTTLARRHVCTVYGSYTAS